MRKLVLLVPLVLLLISLLPVPTNTATSQLLYVKKWGGITYYFYNDKVVITYMNESITLYNMLGAITSELSLASPYISINDNNITYYYNIEKTIFGKTYTFRVRISFLFSMTGACKIKAVIELPIKIPSWIGKALFKWRLVGNYNLNGTRVKARHLFIDFNDMSKTMTLGKISKGNGFIDVETTGFDKKIVIDPLVGVDQGNTEKEVEIHYKKPTNVITNGDFETGDLSGWTTSTDSSGYTSITIDNTTVHSGSYSVKIYSTYAYADTSITQSLVTPETVYNITLYTYIANPGNANNVINLYDSGGNLLKSLTISTNTLNSWVKQTFILDPPVENVAEIEIKFMDSAGDGLEVYLDDIYVMSNKSYTDIVFATYNYWVYSDSNATYQYTYSVEFDPLSYDKYSLILVPKGYDVENITVNNVLVNHDETPYNDTHKYINITLDCTTCNVSAYFTAWNSVVDLYSDYKYYPYGYNATLHARLLDPYLNPINGTNITLWIGAQYKNNQTTLTTQAYIDKGYIIAPHMYKWYFDGVDDFIEVADDPSLDILKEVTVEALACPMRVPELDERVISKNGWSGNYDLYWHADGYWMFDAKFSDDITRVVNSYNTNPELNSIGKYHHVVGRVMDEKLSLIIDLTEITTNIPSGLELVANDNPVYIGKYGYFYGYISFVRVYDRALTDSEISASYNSHVINASGLVLFLDPTFFDGTHYVDLSGHGNHGTPYGGVKRIEDENKWLWIVVNGANDDYVHLKWFPIGSIVRFKDPNTGVAVEEVFISSNDEVVNIPSGNYTIEAIISSGDYTAYTVTTDAGGWANITVTLPDNESYLVYQAEYGGDYRGVKHNYVYATHVEYTENITSLPDLVVGKEYVVTLDAYTVQGNIHPTIYINGSANKMVFIPGNACINCSYVFEITHDTPSDTHPDLWAVLPPTITVTRTAKYVIDSYSVDYDEYGNPIVYYNTKYSVVNGRYNYVVELDNGIVMVQSPDHLLWNDTLVLNIYEIPVWIGSVKAFFENKTISYTVDTTNKKITLTVNGTGYLKVWVGSLGKPAYVYYDGEPINTWFFNSSNNVVYVPINGTIVDLVYLTSFEQASGGGGGGVVVPSPQAPIGNITGKPQSRPLDALGLAIIIISIVGIVMYKEMNKRIPDMWNERVRKLRKRKIKWKKYKKPWE